MADSVYINQQQAADLVGLSAVTIRRRISAGELPAFRSGRMIRIRRDDVLAMFRPIPTTKKPR